MEMDQEFFREHLSYSRYATNKLLEICLTLGSEERTRYNFTAFGSLQGTLLHIFQADRVWLDRVQGITAPMKKDSDASMTIEDMATAWNALFDAWDLLLANEADFQRIITWRSIVLEREVSVPLWQVLLHVVNHGSYHRGQVSMLLRQLGHHSVTNDLVFYQMERNLELAKASSRA
jgi:uncharacterized damage-inducible protein DinB